MTIAISVKVNDGVVLASDSATTLHGTDGAGATGVLKVYNHANKITNLCKGRPIGVLTWGAGAIGDASITTLMKDFRERLSGNDRRFAEWTLPEDYTVEGVAQRLRQFVGEKLSAEVDSELPPQHPTWFLVAGYSSGQSVAEEYRIEATGTQCGPPVPTRPREEVGIVWGGEGDAVARLVLGFAPGLPDLLKATFGLDDARLTSSLDRIRPHLEAPLIWPPMPVQDAIDLAEFLVQTAISFSRFMPGAPVVGGPIEIAAITKHEGFKWVKRKHYFEARFNPEGDK